MLKNIQDARKINVPMDRSAFLFLSHLATDSILDAFSDIQKASSALGDAVFLYYQGNAQDSKKIPRQVPCFSFTDESLKSLPFSMYKKNIVPGSVHFPVLLYFLQNPGYDYYWLIEYDVRFSGAWDTFFSRWRDCTADFLTCHIRRYSQEPEWYWWHLENSATSIHKDNCLRSFNPICRISRIALWHIYHMHLQGWRGHNEVLFATLLARDGFVLRDFGGSGEWVAPQDKGKYYIDSPPDPRGTLAGGSMRWRPVYIKPESHPNILYHPYKQI